MTPDTASVISAEAAVIKLKPYVRPPTMIVAPRPRGPYLNLKLLQRVLDGDVISVLARNFDRPHVKARSKRGWTERVKK